MPPTDKILWPYELRCWLDFPILYRELEYSTAHVGLPLRRAALPADFR